MTAISIENQLNKALRFLDLTKYKKASDILYEVIAEARKENNILFFIRANCVLGELLYSTGEFDKAKQLLATVINTPYENDSVAYEKAIAVNILKQIESL